MRATMRKVNAVANEHGFDFYKGRGYFYFTPMESNGHSGHIDSVYQYHLNGWTLEEWTEYIKTEAK